MARARRSTRTRSSYAKAKGKTYRGRQAKGYSASRRYSGGRYGSAATRGRKQRMQRRNSAGAPRTLKIVVEQQAPQTLSPLQARLLEQGRVVLPGPRRARF